MRARRPIGYPALWLPVLQDELEPADRAVGNGDIEGGIVHGGAELAQSGGDSAAVRDDDHALARLAGQDRDQPGAGAPPHAEVVLAAGESRLRLAVRPLTDDPVVQGPGIGRRRGVFECAGIDFTELL